MRLKGFLALLAAAAVIALGAWMPRLVAQRQDSLNENQVLFADVEAVELEFAQSEMTRGETLAILCRGRDTVQIPEELASLKREKVERIAQATVRKYAESGILLSETAGDRVLSCAVVLIYGQEQQNNVFWQVSYGDPEGEHVINLTIDDRTGIVCAAEYIDQSYEYTPEQMETVFSSFTQLYLTGLGDEFFDYPAQQLLDGAKSAQDGSYIASELFWSTERYGESRITFFVNRTGFYTYFG